MSKIIFTNDIIFQLTDAITEISPDRIFILTDSNTSKFCISHIQNIIDTFQATQIEIPAGDINKNIESLQHIWTSLSQNGATRHSLLINLGGGMTTDIGGFAAATFKRGIEFINIPTTLLAMVDASTGGKTGINFNGLKNEIGAFRDAHYVMIDTKFLSTLDRHNILSGYAEMLKHSLLSDTAMWARHLNFDILTTDHTQWLDIVKQSVAVKSHITAADPYEKSIRKALNFGHTIGHAVESLSIQRGTPILHGHAVAIGMIGELFLSHLLCGFPQTALTQTTRFVRQYYSTPPLSCDDYDDLLLLMQHDKKNISRSINFTLLKDIGQVQTDVYPDKHYIIDAFDYMLQA